MTRTSDPVAWLDKTELLSCQKTSSALPCSSMTKQKMFLSSDGGTTRLRVGSHRAVAEVVDEHQLSRSKV